MKIYLIHIKENSKKTQKEAAHKLLEKLWGESSGGTPELVHGPHGKPYVKGNPWYFNISHSGEYLLLVQGQYEVGVDLQNMRPCNFKRLSKKCCTEEEREWILEDVSEQERLNRFYRVWCRKEAYGKYLGCGLTQEVFAKNTLKTLDTIRFLEYDILEGYHICICCKREEEREEAVHLLEGL